MKLNGNEVHYEGNPYAFVDLLNEIEGGVYLIDLLDSIPDNLHVRILDDIPSRMLNDILISELRNAFWSMETLEIVLTECIWKIKSGGKDIPMRVNDAQYDLDNLRKKSTILTLEDIYEYYRCNDLYIVYPSDISDNSTEKIREKIYTNTESLQIKKYNNCDICTDEYGYYLSAEDSKFFLKGTSLVFNSKGE